jgi:hypothetical protein
MNNHTREIALRLVALTAGIPIIWLSKEFSPRPLDIFLTLLFYLAPNIVIAICPNKWDGFRLGVGIGYPLSMIIALQLYLHARAAGALMPTEPLTPPPPVSAYKAALLLNVALLVTSITFLIWRRNRLGDLFSVILSVVGALAYPYLAFVAIAVLNQV